MGFLKLVGFFDFELKNAFCEKQRGLESRHELKKES